jgi:transposase, IS30 family
VRRISGTHTREVAQLERSRGEDHRRGQQERQTRRVGVRESLGQPGHHRGSGPTDARQQGRHLRCSDQHSTSAENDSIALLKAQGQGVREIARELRRDPGTISREVRRNAATRGGSPTTGVAQWKAQTAARRPKPVKLASNPRLREYVQTRLSGQLQRPDGTVAAGPPTTWKGLNKPHRADRRWATAWSPEQISRRLVLDFPDDVDMRISHEAIYQALYIPGRGALKRELVACLRTGRALRKPRERSRNKPQGHVTADVVFSERPGEAEDRAVPGRWEGDLIIGLNRSAIGTVVERSSRYTLLVHLPRLEGYGTIAPVKNGPALGGYGAIAMKDALTTTMTTMPAELLRSLTWDRGKELSAHAQFKVDTGIAVYLADPHSPWQRGTNENTNGLLRQSSSKAPTCLDFPKAPTCLAGPATSSSRSRRRSTADPGKS